MNEDPKLIVDAIKSLVDAIESLKQEESLIKDYLYPIVLAFFSALMGGYIGYLGILKRESKEAEKAKIDATNKIILEALDCFQDLVGIKGNYFEKLTDNPAQRLLCVPPILMHHRPSNPEFVNLYYLAKYLTKEASKVSQNGSFQDEQNRFANIALLKKVFSNYNTLLEMWKTRNELVLPIFETIVSGSYTTGVAKVDISDMTRLVGHAKLAQAIDLNEKVLLLTDDILAEFVKLMTELPKIAESIISSKALENYGNVFKFKWDTEIQKQFLNRVPVNEAELKKILS